MTILEVEIVESHPVAVQCGPDVLAVTLADGRQLSTPLWWYPRLLAASPAQRDIVRLMPLGMHWPDIDEDISVASMLRGQKAPGAMPPKQVA